MTTYYLTAELDKELEKELVIADCDNEATLMAIDVIMSRAFLNKAGAWAIGKITLSDSKGKTLREMPAK